MHALGEQGKCIHITPVKKVKMGFCINICCKNDFRRSYVDEHKPSPHSDIWVNLGINNYISGL